jgi:hypothetical protein
MLIITNKLFFVVFYNATGSLIIRNTKKLLLPGLMYDDWFGLADEHVRELLKENGFQQPLFM